MVSMVSTTSASSLTSTVAPVSGLAAATIAEMLETIARKSWLPSAPSASHQRILIEYVSANPNGPITAAHARGGVLGDTLATLLSATGNQVTREFYVNDANSSRQMRQFARAVLNRYRQMFGQETWNGYEIDAEGYPEEYVTRTAQHLIETVGDRFTGQTDEDALSALQNATATQIRSEQEQDLIALNIGFDNWFSENELHTAGAVGQTLDRLRAAGHTYEQGKALWLRSTTFGDEADRVLLRADGSATYLAGDLAYHAGKFDRGFDHLIDIWAADHAGYIDRTRAGLAALGYDPQRLTVLLIGPVRLLRDGTEVKASRLDGLTEVITLAELLTELPVDAVRWSFDESPSETAVDIDIDRMRRQDSSNALWAIRYAQSVCKWARENEGDTLDAGLAEKILAFPGAVHQTISTYSPVLLANSLREIASTWTAYISEGNRPALTLTNAVAASLAQGLELLGIDSKDDDA